MRTGLGRKIKIAYNTSGGFWDFLVVAFTMMKIVLRPRTREQHMALATEQEDFESIMTTFPEGAHETPAYRAQHLGE